MHAATAIRCCAIERVLELERRDERGRELVEPGRRRDDVADLAAEHREHVAR